MDLSIIAGLWPVVYGAAAGAICGIAPYLKKHFEDQSVAFDPIKLRNTAIYGALIGLVAAVQGVPYEQAVNIVANFTPFLAAIGLVHVTQNATKAVKAKAKTIVNN